MTRILPILALAACATAQGGSFYTGTTSGGGAGVTRGVAYGSCGSGTSEGDLCIPNDTPIHRVWDGSAWDDYVPGYSEPLAPMPTAGWTQIGVAHTLTAGGGIRHYQAAAGAGLGGHSRSAGSTSFQVDALIEASGTTTGVVVGLYVEEAATSESVGAQFNWPDDFYSFDRPNGPTSGTGASIIDTGGGSLAHTNRIWFRVNYDASDTGAEIDVAYSTDGKTFVIFDELNVATYFTSAPDTYSLIVGAASASDPVALSVLAIRETAL